jgi:hypothetical protein
MEAGKRRSELCTVEQCLYIVQVQKTAQKTEDFKYCPDVQRYKLAARRATMKIVPASNF